MRHAPLRPLYRWFNHHLPELPAQPWLNPTIAPTPSPSPTQIPKLPGPCQNPFIPLAERNRWQYQTKSAAAVLIITSSEWYAPNVGLVKSVVEKATLRSGGLETEIPLDGTIELVAVDLR